MKHRGSQKYLRALIIVLQLLILLVFSSFIKFTPAKEKNKISMLGTAKLSSPSPENNHSKGKKLKYTNRLKLAVGEFKNK